MAAETIFLKRLLINPLPDFGGYNIKVLSA